MIDAFITRVMKSKKELSFNDLVSTILQLSTMFKPQPAMIKERVEDLILRDYLKRSEKDKYINSNNLSGI